MQLSNPFTRIKATTEKLFERASSVRDNFAKRTKEINRITEESVFTATKNISQIVERAQLHLAESKRFVSALSDDGAVDDALRKQNDLIASYQSKMEQLISTQQELSRKASESLQSITLAAKNIEKLSHESQFLALNARIEAGRLGKHGAGISVIAGEMHRLNKSIEDANHAINTLSTSLLSVLPKIGSTVQSMRSSAESFSNELADATSKVEEVTQSISNAGYSLVKSGDSFSEEIIKESYEALSQLQFQDVVAQGLMRVDKWLWELQSECAPSSGVSITPPMHIEIGDEKEIQQANHGEVLLF